MGRMDSRLSLVNGLLRLEKDRIGLGGTHTRFCIRQRRLIRSSGLTELSSIPRRSFSPSWSKASEHVERPSSPIERRRDGAPIRRFIGDEARSFDEKQGLKSFRPAFSSTKRFACLSPAICSNPSVGEAHQLLQGIEREAKGENVTSFLARARFVDFRIYFGRS